MTRKNLLHISAVLVVCFVGSIQAFTVPRPSAAWSTASSLAARHANNDDEVHPLAPPPPFQHIVAAAVLAMAVAFNPNPVWADGSTKDFKLPPVDSKDANRCVLTSSNMGQANAARDKLYDLRQCNLSGKDATGFDLSGVIMSQTDVSKAKFAEAYFSKGYLRDSNFDEADFTNAIVDRANFKGSSLRGTIFKNAVLTGTSFEGANVEGADFTDAYLGSFDIRSLCKNPTLKGQNPVTGSDTRESVGCS